MSRILHLLGPLRKHHTQYTLIPAAAGDKDGFAEFTLGDLRNVGIVEGDEAEAPRAHRVVALHDHRRLRHRPELLKRLRHHTDGRCSSQQARM